MILHPSRPGPAPMMDQTLREEPPLLSNVRTQSRAGHEDFAVSSKLASKPSRKEHDSSESQTQDFVKKLYKMLEDNTLRDVISWGAQGNSFVVKDVNEFTVSILPRIYKHSNFASFVRQLNKYDFHKIKHVDDNSWAEQKWEFKHAHFRAGCRNALQNIKRKTGRKSTSVIITSLVSTTSRFLSSSPEFERQNIRIDSLNARLTSLSVAQQDVVSSVRTLERSHEEVLLQLASFQCGMAKRDGILRGLVHHLVREGDVLDTDQRILLDKVLSTTARKSCKGPADVPEEGAAGAGDVFES
ncbi:HSF-type DNA-binding-domain-containing protein [Mycena olivaceomarginata]|nr:HSF-type DNA-binding-domain-containing protein [Mycena olivaceomarginata]